VVSPAVAKKAAVKESDRREEAFDDFEPPRPRKKKKKKSKSGGGFTFPEFDFLGIHMTLRKWIALICIATVLGLGIYFFWPRSSVAVLDARWVDAYAALEVADRKLGQESHTLFPGGNKLLITRDTTEGQGVLVKVRVPPRFMQQHANTDNTGTLNLQEKDFLLQGSSGEPVKALLVDMEWQVPDGAKGLEIDFSRSPTPDQVIPRERAPWFPDGEIIKKFVASTDALNEAKKKSIGKQTPMELAERPDTVSITGTGGYRSSHGMVVNYEFLGSSANVTWDTKSSAHIGSIYQGLGSSRFMLDSLEMICIFPRPPGNELTLSVMGVKVGKISPH
jgi:hypothetical protein